MSKPKGDSLLRKLETEVRKTLALKTLDVSERLKAIECGVKILAIRHKIEDGGGGEGAFFTHGK